MRRRNQKGAVPGALLALVIVVAIIGIIAAYIAGRGVDSMNRAKHTLSQASSEKDGRKELQEAADALKASLEGFETDDEVTCELIRQQFDHLKRKITEARVKGGVGLGTSWMADLAMQELQDEIDELCPE